MNRTEHLNAIVAKCRANLLLAEKRTQGEWGWQGTRDNPKLLAYLISPSDVVMGCSNLEPSADDAAFIAACAGSAEAGWRSTIAAIDALTDAICDKVLVEGDDFCAMGSQDYYEPSRTAIRAKFQLDAIIAAWPVELLGVGE